MSLFFRSLSGEDVYGDGWATVKGGRGKDAALAVAAVYGAVSLIADSLATLPLHVLQVGATHSRKVETPAWLAMPNPSILPSAWRYQYSTSLSLRGNAYGLVVRDGSRVLGLRWLHPDKVIVDETDSIPIYRVGAQEHTLWQHGGDILHVAQFVQPGSVVGLSPIKQFQRTWETGNAAVDFGHNWFASNAQPTSLLMAKKGLKPGDAKEAKTLFRQAVRDGGPVVLDTDWDYKALTISPEEAQFLATIRATATTVATIYRVSPDDVGGEAASSRTYGNRQDDEQRFSRRTMLPHVVRFEEAVGLLLAPGLEIKLNLDALVRPNLLERSKTYTENLRNGSITLDEVRRLEDRPPLTPAQIEQWQQWYATTKSESESESDATSTAIVKED